MRMCPMLVCVEGVLPRTIIKCGAINVGLASLLHNAFPAVRFQSAFVLGMSMTQTRQVCLRRYSKLSRLQQARTGDATGINLTFSTTMRSSGPWVWILPGMRVELRVLPKRQEYLVFRGTFRWVLVTGAIEPGDMLSSAVEPRFRGSNRGEPRQLFFPNPWGLPRAEDAPIR
ncbi:unnamed protein product, partial [Hapterophycus canaliculatus]